MAAILVLEDDESVNRGIEFTLQKEGYQVYSAFTVKEAKDIFYHKEIQMVLCDINLPDGKGLTFIREIREVSQIHIICLTALDQEMDQVLGYEAGADDYMTKPFSLSVLLLKVHAYFKKQEKQEVSWICSGKLRVNLSTMEAVMEKKQLSLTKNEWKLLCMFLKYPKQILSKRQIVEQLFDMEGDFVDENTLAVNIGRLRKKIEPDLSKPEYIRNIRGIGYLWDKLCSERERNI